ncbi:hypothetical protein BDF20DRAFT_869915 [Mycotypha africana]|uniref:uncharacterized protein n=1 Tax=Mycotypha africana TaxID=64632 RepID=UPI002301C4A9|nr:uncharacterized protein BDF20DRAFT_869915 [Mycotypha africana]KAI8979492.1 hypothetical protein BDF20DRAFT_869915 [Mycotypha africana]
MANIPLHLLLLLHFSFAVRCQLIRKLSLINCSWPCPDESDMCVITKAGGNCQQQTDNDWLLTTRRKAPVYTGPTVTIYLQPCLPAPFPELPPFKENMTLKQGQSVIDWPSGTIHRPLDQYLGNCGHGLYCSFTGVDSNSPVCRQRFDHGAFCVSSNQCLSSYCHDNICHPKTDIISKDNRTTDTMSDNQDSSYSAPETSRKTVIILGSIFGAVGVLACAAICYLLYRCHYRQKQVTTNNEISIPIQKLSVVSSNNIVSQSTLKEEQFVTDFLHEDTQLQHSVSNNTAVSTNTLTYFTPNGHQPKKPPV